MGYECLTAVNPAIKHSYVFNAGTNTCTTAPLTANTTVTANFTQSALTGAANPSNGGGVQCTPIAADGSSACTVSTNPGWRLTGWSNCSRTSGAENASCDMDALAQDTTVTAGFEPYVSGPTQGGSGGMASATFTGGGEACQFDMGSGSTSFVGAPSGLPERVSMPQGLFRFVLSDCQLTPPVTMRVTWPAPVEDYLQWGYENAQAMSSGSYSAMTMNWQADAQDPNTVVLTLTDGQVGDDDWSRNGAIAHASGMVVKATPTDPVPPVITPPVVAPPVITPPVVVPPVITPVTPASGSGSLHVIPTLSELGLALLALLAASLGGTRLRRKSL